jgi:hypothetical protein
MAWSAWKRTSGDSNFQRRWLSTYLAVASSRPALDRLAALLDGKQKVDGLKINQDLRWSIINRLNRNNYPGAAALVDAEQARDKSDTGQAAALAATVVRPDAAVKTEWLGKIQDRRPSCRSRACAPPWAACTRPAERAQRAERRTAPGHAAQVDKAAGPVFMRAYGASMIPVGCSPASVKRLQAAADSHEGPVGRHPPQPARHAAGRPALRGDQAGHDGQVSRAWTSAPAGRRGCDLSGRRDVDQGTLKPSPLRRQGPKLEAKHETWGPAFAGTTAWLASSPRRPAKRDSSA